MDKPLSLEERLAISEAIKKNSKQRHKKKMQNDPVYRKKQQARKQAKKDAAEARKVRIKKADEERIKAGRALPDKKVKLISGGGMSPK
ncbi:hypothetical protein K0504_04540 [Neiella marina]|uniref:Uncharacterized protein n=1 Tax=Neiella holothuriorum TaxID=2870530 RepID=A0ABS7EF35_9GAMM|nr:hypothetical protein [Neiella holothuriorum]MBW8190297.1 hypothetical protein [Neiella holothuriorum]